VALAAAATVPLSAATLPRGFAETPIVFGLSSPTAMAFAPDGRLLVCEHYTNSTVPIHHRVSGRPPGWWKVIPVREPPEGW
jgi:hypothetical protein